MKTTTNIIKIDREDLVDLLSTALYGSSYLSASYDEDAEHDENDCYEEIMADILLKGGCIYLTDYYAEGETYRDWASLDEAENAIYPIFMTDIMRGLENAANGTFKAGENDEDAPDWRERNIRFARRAFDAFAGRDSSDWDALRADCLMQIVLFDEIVYG